MIRDRAQLSQAGASAVLFVILLALRPAVVALAPRYAAPVAGEAVLVAATVIGLAAIRKLVDGLFAGASDQRLVIWRNLAAWALYGLLGILVASELGVNISGLLLGGAILGVVAASASQAPLANFFAGLVLLAGRPFAIGDTVRIRSSASGGVEYEGTLVDSRAFYTSLLTADRELLRLPNSAFMAAVMVVGGDPVQADLEIDTPNDGNLAALKERLEQRLPEAASVELLPSSLDVIRGSLTCRLRVRARARVSPDEVAAALHEGSREMSIPDRQRSSY